MSEQLLIGADPELFVWDAKENDAVSAIGLIGGTKERPRVVKKGAVQEDNILAEINIDPAATEEEFIENILTVEKELHEILEPHGYTTMVKTSYSFKAAQLQHPMANVIGCDPDFSIYTGENDYPPIIGNPVRSAGGHIHVGHSSINEDARAFSNLLYALDYYVGLPLIVLDKDTYRLPTYGQPGCYRPKPYGLEYRTPSNIWMRSEEGMKWVFNRVKKAFFNADSFSRVRYDIMAAISGGKKGISNFVKVHGTGANF